ncbi:SusC/RagA family TonB-linked outer membrane protein [Chitinophaga horti]|uniref:SusC/RagA family TonB-linked outer membrane protein n=1 Tax=Chitinophaga horti TaxID=2920382 RepID=A0ABY6IXU5_9BACT|nr:SusC/RagA family TonB-linked outer membrane protein [Chitinophaga horti]UYQ92208.1 SusC/RagA family TonB-linked outer membrane protein [Chitinophaga horti]
MRLQVFSLLMFMICIHAFGNANAQRITLKANNVTLEKLFEDIERQTGYVFSYKSDIGRSFRTSVNLVDVTIQTALSNGLKGLPLTYQVNDKYVVISEYKAAKPLAPVMLDTSPIKIRGKVEDLDGKPVDGASVRVIGTKIGTYTNAQGIYELNIPSKNVKISISSVGYETYILDASNTTTYNAIIKPSVIEIKGVEISTGYQNLSPERATGSVTLVDNKLLNRTVSADILSRLNGVTNGLLVSNQTGNSLGISVRGRSTIFSSTKPLIVVDNFPFEGDLNTINPDMIESVTVLKDAGAAAIWGVRAGNGVIVITTKKGKLNLKPTVSIKSDLTIAGKPDLWYEPQLSSSEFIDVETYLFNNGAYTSTIDNEYGALSPVVSILQRIKTEPSYKDQGMREIDRLRAVDYRDDQSDYYYRKSVREHYIFDITGGGANQSYYFSAGYDRNRPNLVAQSDERITLKANSSHYLLSKKITINPDITFSKSNFTNNDLNSRIGNLPYEELTNSDGGHRSIVIAGGLRSSYTDTAGRGRLLDWNYRPLDDFTNKYAQSNATLVDYRINVGANYQIIKSLNLSANYQYYNASRTAQDSYSENSFYVRNLINSYTSIGGSAIVRPVPLGGIVVPSSSLRESNYGRVQLNFNEEFDRIHMINFLAGYEARDDSYKEVRTNTLYGYNFSTETNVPVDYVTLFPNYYNGAVAQIPSGNRQYKTTDKYISYYANGLYTYDRRYTISGSFRKDESNLFGVKANQKGVPLWSIGLSWSVLNEKFVSLPWLNLLKLRATYGYNGNINNSVSAYLTAAPSLINPYTNTLYYNIINPPNDFLRWERVKNKNVGLNFSTKNDVISGSIEFFAKDGTDLIGTSPIAPQTGVSQFIGNTADTRTRGIDVQLTSLNIDRAIRWSTTFIFNQVKDEITDYKVETGTNNTVVTSTLGSLTPLKGYPINALFGYRWAGLDGTGSPQGYLANAIVKDYTAIRNSSNRSDLNFVGSGTPITFGSLRNTFSFKGLEVSVNLIYKMNYYFRRNSLNNGSIYGSTIVFKQPDYENRWQKPGDELTTNVPALIYPNNIGRTNFYTYSDHLIERGDHVRIQDIQANYTISKNQFPKLLVRDINVYGYVSNVGVIWRKSNDILDPEVQTGYPMPTTFAVGFKATF